MNIFLKKSLQERKQHRCYRMKHRKANNKRISFFLQQESTIWPASARHLGDTTQTHICEAMRNGQEKPSPSRRNSFKRRSVRRHPKQPQHQQSENTSAFFARYNPAAAAQVVAGSNAIKAVTTPTLVANKMRRKLSFSVKPKHQSSPYDSAKLIDRLGK